MVRHPRSAPVLTLLLLAIGCGKEDVAAPGGPVGTSPALSGDLQFNCYSWPAREFTRDHHATIYHALEEGERAVEFELRDAYGGRYRLSELLVTKPVLLITGSYT